MKGNNSQHPQRWSPTPGPGGEVPVPHTTAPHGAGMSGATLDLCNEKNMLTPKLANGAENMLRAQLKKKNTCLEQS